VERSVYPTDSIGLPLPVEELGFNLSAYGERNNHHMAFYAQSFGRFAISNTFRNLEAMQVNMPVSEHTRLHQHYEGIELPRPITMLDAIYNERFEGRGLQIYHHNLPAGERYQKHPITDALWHSLMIEYSSIQQH